MAGILDLSDTPKALFHPSYRSDVDGLRGIAVLLVIGFHAFPQWVRGGFVGVDVFFVISGYLISRVVLGSLEQTGFSFSDFYARRIRRIFPALIVVLLACYVWGWFNLFAADYRQLGKHMAASAGFVANFVLWKDTGYFDNAAARKPLLHLWSLGIEEQFYVVWPLLLYVAWRRRVSVLWPTVLVLIISFLLNVYEVHRDVVAAFYSPVTRVWELAMGATLACVKTHTTQWWAGPHRSARDLASVAGVTLIAVSVLALDKATLFPGWWAALPTTGASLLIATGPDAWFNRSMLSRRIFVWVGLISYPLYLWHWPLLSFATIAQSRTPSLEMRVAAIAASGLLAWLTYRLIERPVRYGPVRVTTVPVLCSLLAVIVWAASTTYWSDGFAERKLNLSDRAQFVQYYDSLHKEGLGKAYWDACDFMDWKTGNTKSALDPDCTRPGQRRTVLLWGDSYAEALSLGLRRLLPQEARLAQIATSACSPRLTNIDVRAPSDRCSRSNNRAVSAIRELSPDVVVLAQMSGHESTDWEGMADGVRALGAKNVVLIGPAPQWQPSLPLVIASRYWGRDYGRVKYGLDPSVFGTDAALKKRYEHASQLVYISMVEHLCNDEGCLAVVPGGDRQDLIAVDSGHLSPKGSIFVVDKVLGPYLLGR